jgi:Tfp pilus assembly protein PilO
MMDTASIVKQEIAVDTQTLKNKEAFLSSLSVKIEQLAALPEVEKQMATILPDTDRTQDTIRVLHEYATQAGLTITEISNNSPTNDAKANAARARGDVVNVPLEVRTLEFQVGVTGSYEQVRLYLTLLGKSPRVIDVKDVQMGQIVSQPGQITSSITMQLYSQQIPQNPGLKYAYSMETAQTQHMTLYIFGGVLLAAIVVALVIYFMPNTALDIVEGPELGVQVAQETGTQREFNISVLQRTEYKELDASLFVRGLLPVAPPTGTGKTNLFQ